MIYVDVLHGMEMTGGKASTLASGKETENLHSGISGCATGSLRQPHTFSLPLQFLRLRLGNRSTMQQVRLKTPQ